MDIMYIMNNMYIIADIMKTRLNRAHNIHIMWVLGSKERVLMVVDHGQHPLHFYFKSPSVEFELTNATNGKDATQIVKRF